MRWRGGGNPGIEWYPRLSREVRVVILSLKKPELGAGLDHPDGSFSPLDWTQDGF